MVGVVLQWRVPLHRWVDEASDSKPNHPSLPYIQPLSIDVHCAAAADDAGAGGPRASRPAGARRGAAAVGRRWSRALGPRRRHPRPARPAGGRRRPRRQEPAPPPSSWRWRWWVSVGKKEGKERGKEALAAIPASCLSVHRPPQCSPPLGCRARAKARRLVVSRSPPASSASVRSPLGPSSSTRSRCCPLLQPIQRPAPLHLCVLLLCVCRICFGQSMLI